MPPKGKGQKENKKTEQKKKDKIIEDKTFGLKNKKGGKQQKFIKNVTHQVKYGNNPKQQRLDGKEADKKGKSQQSDLDDLLKPVLVQSKVGKGADPKSVLCAFFKQGMCQKGAKCKFSHDLAVERKSEKRSLYQDERDEDLKNDTMDTWDDAKLQTVINKKHGEKEKNKNKTTIVCKYFLQAIEEKKYGWFWTCPNGGNDCMYRHALPPGYILKSDQKKMDEQKEKISLEDLIERERAALGSNVTKITLESFLKWKKKKKQEKIKSMEAKKQKKKSDFKSGNALGVSGREMFEFRPELIIDDEEDGDVVTYEREEETDPDMKVVELNLGDLSLAATEVDDTGTQAPGEQDRFSAKPPEPESGENTVKTDHLNPETSASPEDAVPVDEDLFTEDLDDLDELDDL